MRRILRYLTPVVCVAAAALAFGRVSAKPQRPVTSRYELPTAVKPRYNDPRVVSDEQLAAVLPRVRPEKARVETNVLVHALRLWGKDAKFQDDASWSGSEMREFLTNDAVFQKHAGKNAPPLISREENRVVVRGWQAWDEHQDFAAAHTNDLLATLAEIGEPLDAVIHTRSGDITVRELLDSALQDFHRGQLEYEWTGIAYARYCPDCPRWRNRYGESLDVNALVEEMIQQPILNQGVCIGTHRIEALVVLLAVDEQTHALSKFTRKRILNHLREISALLVKSQSPEGCWDRYWHQPREQGASAGSVGPKPTLADQILATGHHLEWLALAPEEVHPPREVIVRAGQWLSRAMTEVDDKTLAEQYGPFTHGTRALSLWRGAEPFEQWNKLNAEVR